MSVFIKNENQWIACENIKPNASINDCLGALGYDNNQFYSYTDYHQTYDDEQRKDNIFAVCLKVMSEDIICVIANEERKTLTDNDVSQYMKNFDFKSQYSLYSMESDLKMAIALHNYSIKFVADALGLPYSPDDKVLYSEKLKYNFFFEGGILIGYETADGYNREAHELKESSPGFYELIEKHARDYYGMDDNDAVREINIQAKAYQNIPGGVRNEYFYDFQNADKSFNMAMLLVVKYQGTQYELCLNYNDCKCVCHNELTFEGEVTEGLDKMLRYKYRGYIISFDAKGRFLKCEAGLGSHASSAAISMKNEVMEKKVFALDFKLEAMSAERLQILVDYLKELSRGKTPTCYVYSLGGSIGCYDDNNNIFYTFNDTGLKAWTDEEGVLVGILGRDEIESPEIEGVTTLPLTVYFHAKECDDTLENAIYHIRVLQMEVLRRMGITF